MQCTNLVRIPIPQLRTRPRDAGHLSKQGWALHNKSPVAKHFIRMEYTIKVGNYNDDSEENSSYICNIYVRLWTRKAVNWRNWRKQRTLLNWFAALVYPQPTFFLFFIYSKEYIAFFDVSNEIVCLFKQSIAASWNRIWKRERFPWILPTALKLTLLINLLV